MGEFYAWVEAGGARPERVRTWLRRAAARAAASECEWASKAGKLAEAGAKACCPGVDAAAETGNAGQVEGVVKMDVPDVASAMRKAASIDMAQWCAP